MMKDRELLDRRRKLKIGKMKLESPVRSLTVQDINAKRRLPTEIPLEAELYVIHTKLKPMIFGSNIERSNNYFFKIIRALESTYGDFQGIQWLMPYFYFTKEETKILKESHINKLIKTLSLLLINDADYTFENILVESPFQNKTLSEKFFINFQKNLQKISNIDITPVIDIDTPLFLRVFSTLKNYGIKSIGVRYKPIQRHLMQYLDLMEEISKDEDTTYFILDVERFVPKTFRSIIQDFALPHIMPFLEFDIIVPKSTVNIYNPNMRFVPTKIKANLRFMLREEMKVPLFTQMKPEERQLALNELDIDYYKDQELSHIKDIITGPNAEKNIETLLIDIKKPNENKKEIREKMEMLLRIKALSKVQEPKASIKEIQYFKRRKDPTDYLLERPNLEESLKTIYAFGKL